MKLFKSSFFLTALSILVLSASVTPLVAMNTFSRPGGHKRGPKSKSKPVRRPSVRPKPEPVQVKRERTWQEKLRKKIKKMKEGFLELIGENPAKTLAAVVGSAVALWLIWKFGHTPWEHRENAVGNAACDVMEEIAPQGYDRTINHVFFDQNPVRNPVTGRYEDGEVQRRDVQARFRLAHQTPITQLHVATQWFDASCAYHAAKNCILILNELTNPQRNLQARLDDHNLCNQFFGRNGAWRQLIVQDPVHIAAEDFRDDGDWLGGNAVRTLINHEYANHQLLDQAYNENILQVPVPHINPAGEVVRDDHGQMIMVNRQDDHSPITIIEDANRINHPNPLTNATSIVRDDLDAAIRNNNEYRHGFIFNTARTINGRVPGRDNGHWMAAVLHCNAQGQIRWYCADSGNRSMLQGRVLRDLIAAVQGVQVP